MAQAVKKKLVVAGGNGFLGSRICKSAVSRGWDVTSIRYIGSLNVLEPLLTCRKPLRRTYVVLSDFGFQRADMV